MHVAHQFAAAAIWSLPPMSQHSPSQRSTVTAHYNTAQRSAGSAAQHSTAQQRRITSQRSAAQRSTTTAQCSTAQPNTAQRSTDSAAQHSTAPLSAAESITSQCSTAQHHNSHAGHASRGNPGQSLAMRVVTVWSKSGASTKKQSGCGVAQRQVIPVCGATGCQQQLQQMQSCVAMFTHHWCSIAHSVEARLGQLRCCVVPAQCCVA